MNIDNSLSRIYETRHHQYQANGVSDTSSTQVGRSQHHRHRDNDDELKLSDAAKATKTEKTAVDLNKPLEAEHVLHMQIISQMMKRITGQDLQLTAPADLKDQVGGISVQAPQQPPATQANDAKALTYQQSMTYFEAQVTTFNAEGSISTKDGQSVKFSVSLSMSHLFYSQATMNSASDGGSNTDPLQVSFNGMAAELTTTSFKFSIDSSGSSDQVATTPKPGSTEPASSSAVASVPAPAQNNSVKADNDDDKAENSHQATLKLDDMQKSFLDTVKNFFTAMRVWQDHSDGSQQLMALGEQSVGAIFLGHLTQPLAAPAPKKDDVPGVLASGTIVVPEQAKPSTTPPINITA